MIGKKINQLATELAPNTTDLTIIGDPISGVSKKITLEQLGAIFGGAVSFYTTLGDFPATGVIDIIYCAKDTKKLYLWSGSAYVEVFPSQSLLDTYQLRSEKGVSNGYASLDVNGKVPIGQLPNSIMEYKGTWSAATNTPTLANGTGDTGDVYICNAAGTVNFGAGPLTFAVGDYVVYSGTIWQRSSGAVGTVTSVAASITGDAIGITGSPVTTSGTLAFAFGGNSTQYINGAGNLVTFPGVINEAQNLITEVYNKTGATLTKGTVVYINGGQGNLPAVTKALATGDSTSAQTYGIVRNDITNNNNGYVVVAGRISDLDTQAYTEGTQLYLSPTTAGTYTSTKPYAPNHLVYVGIVVRAHPTQGVVEVKIQNGYEMDELHNVAAQSPDNNDILQYKTATSLWTKVAGTTSNIAEGSNLYYTDARSRAALSFTAGSGAYNSTTGVITIPTNTNQLTNGAAFITLASLSAGAGISYNNTTGVIASTITQYTDALARAAISLTTTGTSGAATYNSTTGVLNVPQYAPDLSGYVPTSRTLTINGTAYDLSANRSWSVGTVTSVGLSSATSGVTIGSTPITTSGTITLAIATASGSQQGLLSSTDWTTFNNKQSALTNPVTGTGTTNYLPKFTGTSSIGNSQVFDNGTNVGIGTASVSGTYEKLAVAGGISIKDNTNAKFEIGRYNTTGAQNSYIKLGANSNSLRITNNTDIADLLELTNSGNLGLGVTPSAWGSAYKVAQYQGGFVGSDGTSYIYFGQNAYSDGTFKYLANGLATIYAQDAGKYIWYQAPSGTAGNAISFTQAMTLNASGNLLLGTTTDPGYGRATASIYASDGGIVRVAGSSTTALFYVYQPYNTAYLGTTSNHNLSLITNDTARLTIASTGAATFSSSVTAGAAITNAATLHVNNASSADPTSLSSVPTTNVFGMSTSPGGMLAAGIGTTGGTHVWLQGRNVGGAGVSYPISLQPLGGNVGIGTTSPTSLLHLYSSASSNTTQKLEHSSTFGAFQIINNASSTLYVGVNNSAGSLFGGTGGAYGGAISMDSAYALGFATSGSERMRITSGGEVGIGTTTMSSGIPLSISAGVGLNTNIAFQQNAVNKWFIRNLDSTDDFSFYYAPSSAERMRITSSGNVEINTGSIKTGAPTNGTAQPWKLGNAVSGAISTDSYIIVSVNGTTYSIPALNGLP